MIPGWRTTLLQAIQSSLKKKKKTALAIWQKLCFWVNFGVICFSSVGNVIDIMIEIALNQ